MRCGASSEGAGMLTLICPGPLSGRLRRALQAGLAGWTYEVLTELGGPLTGRRLLFAVSLDESGVNLALSRLLALLRTQPDALSGCAAGVIVDGAGELYTKSAARELVLAANAAGCAFPGRPLVEAVGPLLSNLAVQAKNAGCGLEEAYHLAVGDLARRLMSFSPPRRARPKVLALHASSRRTSNTLALWSGVRDRLEGCDVREIGLRNGTLEDCGGCPYTTCLHFGERGGCFYGGVMVQDVYPAVREADALVMICPNYNDAVSANLTAAINRLTALYRAVSFADKALYGIVVSGYSGGDIVASQLVSALCMNKGFFLPPHFCLLATANDAGAAMKLPGIDARLAAFAARMRSQLLLEE